MRATAREWQRLGCAAVLGAIIAFPAGILFSGRGSVEQNTIASRAQAPAGEAQARKPYSPDVLSDPYVLQQHREIVEALEMSCRQTGEGCAEAKRARRYLHEREANRAR
jgi:hypothetical protein